MAVLIKIAPGLIAEIVAFVGKPRPVMAMPVARPSMEGTSTVWLPAVVDAPAMETGMPPRRQVRLAVPEAVAFALSVMVLVPMEEMIALAGIPVPRTDMPTYNPATDGTPTVLLPLFVVASFKATEVGGIATVKVVVPFTAVIGNVPLWVEVTPGRKSGPEEKERSTFSLTRRLCPPVGVTTKLPAV